MSKLDRLTDYLCGLQMAGFKVIRLYVHPQFLQEMLSLSPPDTTNISKDKTLLGHPYEIDHSVGSFLALAEPESIGE